MDFAPPVSSPPIRRIPCRFPPSDSAGQQGVSLIEVLIALVVITLGLLSVAALQGKAQKAEMESYQRSQALILLHNMAERLRANRPGRSEYIATVGHGGSFHDTTHCNTGAGALRDLSCWNIELSETLTGGLGCIVNDNVNDGNGFVLTIAWHGMIPIVSGTNDPRKTNACGQGLWGDDRYRRIVSTPVRFFIPD